MAVNGKISIQLESSLNVDSLNGKSSQSGPRGPSVRLYSQDNDAGNRKNPIEIQSRPS